MRFYRYSSVWVALIVIGPALVIGLGTARAQRPLGIDVSSYQGSADMPPTYIDWPTVQASGVTFAFVKATEGLTITDPDFVYNVTQAKAAGVLVGAYHLARPEFELGTTGADESAAQFWSVAGAYIIADGMSLMPVLDYEIDPNTDDNDYYTQATSSLWVNEWCQDIVNYGRSSGVALTPIVYTYNSFATEWLDSTVTQWPVWIGNPNPDPPQTGAPDDDTPWSTWNFWQYIQLVGSVPGVENGVDLDVFNGSAADLSDYKVFRARPVLRLNTKTALFLELSWVESQPMPGDPPPGPSPPFFGVQVAYSGNPNSPGSLVSPAWTNFSGFVRPFSSQFVARDVIGSSPVFYELSSGVISQYIPGPTTLSASNITTTCATLCATDIPVGSNTLYWFEYGTDTNYTNGVTVTNGLATSTNPAALSAPVGRLTPSTLYHFQVLVTDDWGTQYGGDQTFTTLAPASLPMATTLAATSVTSVNAQFNGTVNSDGADTTWWFEYGYDTNYSIANTASAVVSASNTNAVPVNILAGGLYSLYLYHFQLVASNSAGVSYGGDQQFATLGPPPTLVTLAASSITTTTATLNGTVNGNGSGIAGYFQYDVGSNGSTYSYNTSGQQFYTSGNYFTAQEFSTTISNLAPGTPYHYRIIAFNASSEGFGADTNFTTSSGGTPTIVSEGVSGVTNGTAVVEGYVNPNGLSTTVYFQYGPYYEVDGTNYPDSGGTNSIGATAQTVYFSFSGVDTSTPYDFRVVAVNSLGTNYGTNVQVSAP